MVIGGAASLKAAEEEKEPKIVGNADGVTGEGKSVLATDEFWSDLKGFLVQRLKDEKEGEKVWGVFRDAKRGRVMLWTSYEYGRLDESWLHSGLAFGR